DPAPSDKSHGQEDVEPPKHGRRSPKIGATPRAGAEYDRIGWLIEANDMPCCHRRRGSSPSRGPIRVRSAIALGFCVVWPGGGSLLRTGRRPVCNSRATVFRFLPESGAVVG